MTQTTDATSTTPVAFNLQGLDDRQQERRAELWNALKAQIREVVETPAGYALRFDSKPGVLMEMSEIVSLEVRCCPFLRFEIEVAADGGPTWLRLSGREGVKDLLAGVLIAKP
jgi:hypothetical protein